MIAEKIVGAQTALDQAAKADRLLTELGLAVIDARDANTEKLLQTSLFLRLSSEGKDSAAVEIAERACRAERDLVGKMALVYTLMARLSGAR